jgi:hypothetical protein
VLASRLTPVSTNRYFRGVFFPSVTYSLLVNTIPENKLAKLQSQTYQRFLPKLGYNRNMPAAVVHGPSSLGGWTCAHCMKNKVQAKSNTF